MSDDDGRREGAQPVAVSPGAYKRLTVGFSGYAMAMIACLALVGVIALLTPRGEERSFSIDYQSDLWALRNGASYTPYAPEGLPDDWRPNSSRLHGLDGDGAGPVSWSLGFATPDEEHAAVNQSDERPAANYIARMTNRREPDGTRQVAGAAWDQHYFKDKNQRSLVRRLPKLTLVVTGTASYEELAVLAGSLRPQQDGS